jgi:epoxyqueuosine reductase
LPTATPLVAEHIEWALQQQKQKSLLAVNLLPRSTERLVRIIQKGLPRDAG